MEVNVSTYKRMMLTLEYIKGVIENKSPLTRIYQDGDLVTSDVFRYLFDKHKSKINRFFDIDIDVIRFERRCFFCFGENKCIDQCSLNNLLTLIKMKSVRESWTDENGVYHAHPRINPDERIYTNDPKPLPGLDLRTANCDRCRQDNLRHWLYNEPIQYSDLGNDIDPDEPIKEFDWWVNETYNGKKMKYSEGQMFQEYLADMWHRGGKYFEQAIKDMPYDKFLQSIYWKVVAKESKRLAHNKCSLCASPYHLNVNHRHYGNHGNEHNHLEDLLCICQECHYRHHNTNV